MRVCAREGPSKPHQQPISKDLKIQSFEKRISKGFPPQTLTFDVKNLLTFDEEATN
jgi:hypothetical protein